MLYETPWMEVLKLDTLDVITTSITVGGNHDFNNPPDYSDETDQDW